MDTVADNQTSSSSTPLPVSLADVKSSLTDFKRVSTAVFRELCDKEGLEMPEILYQSCPSVPTTSCTAFLVDPVSNKVVKKPTVYLNPNVYGLRTIIHEFMHYAHKMKGNDKVALDEYEVERLAQGVIDREFPEDKIRVKAQENAIIVKDTMLPNSSSIKTDYLNTFPMFAKYRSWRLKSHDPSLIDDDGEIQHEHDNGGGFISNFDSIFEPLGKAVNLPAREVNVAHTSNIISQTVMTIAESNLSPLGSVVLSTISSITLFGASMFYKSNIGRADRTLLSQLSANFLYNGIGIANPNIRDKVIEQAKHVGEHLSKLQFQDAASVLLANPGPHQANAVEYKLAAAGQTSPQRAAYDAGVSRRQAQRSIGRSNSGGGGQAGAGGPTIAKKLKPEEQQTFQARVNEQQLRRMEQKATGQYQGPQDPNAVRNFPTPTRPRPFGAGIAGVNAPAIDDDRDIEEQMEEEIQSNLAELEAAPETNTIGSSWYDNPDEYT